ncbi:hypothetical protein [Yinghuangia aomiensis]|uniref:hypothetical protein n=1 Tax=Yinghuangia aomiensis TaxID=676205 RepID=UPI0031E9D604
MSGRQARADAARLRDKAADYNTEREGIPDGTESDEGDDEAQTPLDALRRGYERAQTAESVLADRVPWLEEQVSEARQQLARRPPEVRAHAQLLLTSPVGQGPASRHNALEHARTSVEDAVGRQSSAETQAQRLEGELAHVEQLHAQPPRRILPNAPTTSEEASLLREQQEVLAQEALRRWNRADELIKKLDHQREHAHARMTLLSTLSDSLPSPQEIESAEFRGDDTRARAETTAARDKLAAAQQGVIEAESELNTAVDGLRRTASLGADQTILSEALAALVKESLSLLGKAERASQMTTASGSRSGQRVLRIRFDCPTDHDLVAYSERVVRKGLKPEGMALLKEAVHEAADPRGFSVKALKPTDDDTGITEGISRLAKWSGGEKLTVCVALYRTLAAHTGRHGTSGGVLPLDNPIGRASSAPLIRLQQNVAASHGVQLVYTTGVKDPAAVIRFPNIIRLDNRGGRTKNRRYIVPDTPPLDPNSTPTGGPAQRASIITGSESRTTTTQTAHPPRRPTGGHVTAPLTPLAAELAAVIRTNPGKRVPTELLAKAAIQYAPELVGHPVWPHRFRAALYELHSFGTIALPATVSRTGWDRCTHPPPPHWVIRTAAPQTTVEPPPRRVWPHALEAAG